MADATRRVAHRAGPWMRGPELVFAATLLIAFVGMAAGTKLLASDLVLPATSTLFFVLAGLVAVIAACRRRTAEPVPRTRSSRIPCREFDRELRVQRGTRIMELLVVFDSEVRKRGCRRNDANFGIGPLAPVTYWDVAGALTMFGICVASQIDPDEMARLVTGTRRGD